MNVLSLFNGCGMLRPALEKAGIEAGNYYSSEIDKYASFIANKNYPDTNQLGDIAKWQDWDLPKIDLLTAGFPCQSHSISGKRKGFNDPRGQLFFSALEVFNKYDLKYFLFENVAGMGEDEKNVISRELGVNPVELNSKYWGAQHRKRLFWTNIPGAKNIEIMQARNDKKIYLKDILIDGATDREKSYCLDACYAKGASLEQYLKKGRRQLVFTSEGARKLYPIECERLMNLPDNYTEGVSNAQRYKMLGNGWDVDVVADLLRGITEPVVDIQPDLFEVCA